MFGHLKYYFLFFIIALPVEAQVTEFISGEVGPNGVANRDIAESLISGCIRDNKKLLYYIYTYVGWNQIFI